MAARYRVTGQGDDGDREFEVHREEDGGLSHRITIGELTTVVTLYDETGEKLAEQSVQLADGSPMALQRAVRRFLAEERPGDDFQFEEAAAEAPMMAFDDGDDDGDDDDEYDDDEEYEDDEE